jgi:hypothetical protein
MMPPVGEGVQLKETSLEEGLHERQKGTEGRGAG